MPRPHRAETRLTWQERVDLEALALRRGLTISTLLRGLIIQAIDKELERDALRWKMYPQS